MTKEEMKNIVYESIHENFPLFSDYMTIEEYETLKPLLGMVVLSAFLRIKNYKEKRKNVIKAMGNVEI